MVRIITVLTVLATIPACGNHDDRSDAYGNFEAREVTVSTEIGGRLLGFSVEDGAVVRAGEPVGLIDTTQLDLNRRHLRAQREAVRARMTSISAQADVHRAQLEVTGIERDRIERMLAEGAATQKQMDNVTGQILVAERQIAAAESQRAGILQEISALDAQIDQVSDQIARARIVNPIDGRVLVTYADQYELVSPGRPLYKVADLNIMYLRAYVSGRQVPHARLGQEVNVLIDDAETGTRSMPGEIVWIADRAEFTPTVIQTREERVNQVYAVRIRVVNDGSIKIGMPGEIRFARGDQGF